MDMALWSAEPHPWGIHLGNVMTRKRQYLSQRASSKMKLPFTSSGWVSCSVGTIGRQRGEGTILCTFQSLLEVSLAVTPWTSLLEPLFLELQILSALE